MAVTSHLEEPTKIDRQNKTYKADKESQIICKRQQWAPACSVPAVHNYLATSVTVAIPFIRFESCSLDINVHECLSKQHTVSP